MDNDVEEVVVLVLGHAKAVVAKASRVNESFIVMAADEDNLEEQS